MEENKKLVLSIKPKQDTNGHKKMNSDNYEIKLNEWELGDGVLGIELNATAGKIPQLIIRCHPDKIEIDGLDVETFIQKNN